MSKTLQMVFSDEGSKSVILSLAEPKDGLLLAEVKAAADIVIAKNAFLSKNGELVKFIEGRIVNRDVTVIMA